MHFNLAFQQTANSKVDINSSFEISSEIKFTLLDKNCIHRVFRVLEF